MSPITILTYLASGETQRGKEQTGKFLQLIWLGQEYLLFAPFEVHRYHNQVLGHFLQDNAAAHHWGTDEKLEVDDPNVRVIGGGRYRVHQDQETLELWDNSQAYGRFDDSGLAERIAAAGHAWRDFKVKIT